MENNTKEMNKKKYETKQKSKKISIKKGNNSFYIWSFTGII